MQLYKYQIQAVESCLEFLTSPNRFVFNAMQQRLGKTPISIICADELNVKNVLVAGPLSVTQNWIRQFDLWSVNKPKVTSISHARLRKVGQEKKLKTQSFKPIDLFILDEARAAKNLAAQITKVVYKQVLPVSKYAIFLDGTPIPHSVVDLWPVCARYIPNSVLLEHDITTKDGFASKFTFIVHNGRDWTYKGVRNADLLKKLIREHFLYRRTRAEVAPELPGKEFSEIRLPKQYADKLSAEEWKELKWRIENGDQVSERQEAGLKKLPMVVNFIREQLEQGDPIIVYAYHTAVIDELLEKFKDLKPAWIDGRVTSATKRQKAIDEFQDGTTDLFIGQVAAAGSGVTLDRGNVIVLAELTYSPAELSQCTDRSIAIGKKEMVMVYYFVAEGSLDIDVLSNCVDKARCSAAVLDG